MDIGLISTGGPPQIVERYVQTAEAAGFASLWASEHVVFFEDFDPSYPYAEGGRPPMATDTAMMEPLNLLSFIAAKTERLRLGTGVFLLPQRNPVYTAKETSTLDVLSGGRLDFGIGVGWLREEFEAVNVPFEERGARCDEYIEVLKRLWTQDVAEYSGRFYALAPCIQEPHPVQKPHPPILIGGTSAPAIRRAARLGDGWVAINLSPEEAAQKLTSLRAQRQEAGLSMDRFRSTLMAVNYAIEPDDLAHYRDAGIDQIVLPPMRGDRILRTDEDLFALVEEIGERFVGVAAKL
ncbi:MAG: LLM class F420-dependent oxidoreductase [bacterium]|nr:LLM class F420-dependent oxidoreductase [Deltaproteobacteria bacterium]MCP4905492.1 LLM class F420-dependent oxidoreductase [bacterium]